MSQIKLNADPRDTFIVVIQVDGVWKPLPAMLVIPWYGSYKDSPKEGLSGVNEKAAWDMAKDFANSLSKRMGRVIGLKRFDVAEADGTYNPPTWRTVRFSPLDVKATDLARKNVKR